MASNVRHIDLPLQVAGLVVGKKGVKINQIKQRSRAHVELAKDTLPSDENLKRLTIKGSNEELDKAEEMVYDLLLKWCVGEGSEGNFALLPVEVQRRIKEMPDPIAGGQGDERDLRLDQRDAHPHQQPTVTEDLLLLQQQQQMQQQQQQQLQLQALQQQMLQQQVEPVTIAVPSDCFRVLARDSGSQIASIESMSKAKISYARWKQTPESTDTWLAIYGEPDNVRNARDMLVQIVDHLRARLRLQAQQQPAGVGLPSPIGGLQGPSFGVPAMDNMMGALGVAGDAQALNMGSSQFNGAAVGGGGAQLAVPPMLAQAFANPQLSAASPLNLAGGMAHMGAQAGADNMQMLQQIMLLQQQQQQQQQQLHQQQQTQQQQQQQQPPVPPLQASMQAQPEESTTSPLQFDSAIVDASGPVKTVHTSTTTESTSKDHMKISVQVPSGAAGLVVGKKGAGIKRFKQQAGVKVSIPYGETSEEGMPNKTVVLEGAGASVEQGLLMLAELLDSWSDKDASAQLRGFDEWLRVLQEGRKDEVTKQSGTSAKVRQGGRDERERARSQDETMNVASTSGRGEKPDGVEVRLRVVIPLAGAGMIVGKQGKTIKSINAKTGAFAALAKDPLESDPTRKELTIKGTRGQVHAAKDELLAVMLQWLRNAADEEGGGAEATMDDLLAKVHEEEEEEVVTAPGKPPNNASVDGASPGEKANGGHQSSSRQEGAGDGAGMGRVKGTKPVGRSSTGKNSGLELISDTSDGGTRRMEMFVTVAAAAMIIGKKGLMLKQLHTKSNATITIDQMQQADGTKRVCIEGPAKNVDVAFRSIQDMVKICDEAKYEEAARQRQLEESAKKQEEEAARQKVQERQAVEASRKDAAKRMAEEQARRELEEKKWSEKQEKQRREVEEKKKLAAKIAANPFAFLDDGDGAAADEDDEDASSPKRSDKKKKKKGRGGGAGSGSDEHVGDGLNAADDGVPGDRVRRQSNVSMKSAQSNGDVEASASDDEEGADMIGLDRLLKMHEELQPEESNNSFTAAQTEDSSAALAAPVSCLEVHTHSLTRRGITHANEDRLATLDLSTLMSEDAVNKFLDGSEQNRIPFFLVLDGHGGSGIAEAACSLLPRKVAAALERLISDKGASGADARALLNDAMVEGFEAMEEESISLFKEGKGDVSGACAVCVVLTDTGGKYTLSVANCGDCRAVVARKENAKFNSIMLTSDHRATVNSEKARIESCGGHVTDKRALGDLIPSRTLGDIKTKRKCPGAVIAVPEVSSHPLLYGEDCALVLASDGLWDELKNAKVMELLCKHYHPNSAKSACTAITQAVLKKCTGGGEKKPNDDLTVLVVSFAWH